MEDNVKVYENVASTLQEQLDTLLSDYEDNLVMKMQSEVKGYDADVAAEDLYGPAAQKYGKLRENAILDLVEAYLAILFAK